MYIAIRYRIPKVALEEPMGTWERQNIEWGEPLYKIASKGQIVLAMEQRTSGNPGPGAGPACPLAISHEPWAMSHETLRIDYIINRIMIN